MLLPWKPTQPYFCPAYSQALLVTRPFPFSPDTGHHLLPPSLHCPQVSSGGGTCPRWHSRGDAVTLLHPHKSRRDPAPCSPTRSPPAGLGLGKDARGMAPALAAWAKGRTCRQPGARWPRGLVSPPNMAVASTPWPPAAERGTLPRRGCQHTAARCWAAARRGTGSSRPCRGSRAACPPCSAALGRTRC